MPLNLSKCMCIFLPNQHLNQFNNCCLLLFHKQVDVIESQFYEMLDKINESKDFEIIRSTHETFLANLLSQVLLNKRLKNRLVKSYKSGILRSKLIFGVQKLDFLYNSASSSCFGISASKQESWTTYVWESYK